MCARGSWSDADRQEVVDGWAAQGTMQVCGFDADVDGQVDAGSSWAVGGIPS